MSPRRLCVLAAVLACAFATPGFAVAQKTATAIFAGGCFWTVEKKFEATPGVINAVSGYTGGELANPTYDQVSEEQTDHVEAVKVSYDPSRISYRQLLDAFWLMIDPTNEAGQACDIGEHYRTAIFYGDDNERQAALDSRKAIDNGPRKGNIMTAIRPATTFWDAEAEHQDFARKNPQTYAEYYEGCRREEALARVWADRRK
jgi:peptide-methionine (S)-S-oxide reductase